MLQKQKYTLKIKTINRYPNNLVQLKCLRFDIPLTNPQVENEVFKTID